jgi:hypothetical protein
VIVGGDIQQILPVFLGGFRSQIIEKYLEKSP